MSSRYLASYVPSAGGAAAALAADAAAVAAASASLTTAIQCAASAVAAASASAALTTGIPLAADAQSAASSTASLTTGISLQAAAAAVAAAAADLTTGSAGGGADPAAVWSYVLPNGMTAGATLAALHTLMSELHLVHGLTAGSPMSVSTAQRRAGAVTQSIADNGAGLVTVTRQ